MIDDTKDPCDFSKEDGVKFTKEEVVLEKTFTGGRNQLQNNSPWDILLIDWQLGDENPNWDGILLLEHLLISASFDEKVRVDKIIIITRDNDARKRMSELCTMMIGEGTLKSFEVQNEFGQIVKL